MQISAHAYSSSTQSCVNSLMMILIWFKLICFIKCFIECPVSCDDFNQSYLSWIWELMITSIRRVKWKKRKTVNEGIFYEQNIYFIIRIFLAGPKVPALFVWLVTDSHTHSMTHSLRTKNANLYARILKLKT